MKTISSIFIALAIAGGLVSTAHAQHDMTAFSYVMSYPVLETREFIADESFRGFCLEGRKFWGENVSGGMSASWLVFDQQVTDPITKDNITVSGKQFRYINAFPLYLNAHYHTGKPRGARLYVGANIGAAYMKERLDIGLVSLNENNWQLGLAPEMGILLPIGESHVLISGKFNWAFSSNSSREQSYFSLGVGFSYSAIDYLY